MDQKYLIECIVEVKCKKNNKTLGTGFWVTHDGYVLTCWHVINMCPDDLVISWKEQEYDAKFCPGYSWPDEDIAVLTVPGNGFKPIPLGTHWEIGDKIWARGSQYYGSTNKGWRGYSVHGEIIGPGDYQDEKGKHEYIQIEADVEHGLSGAMLFDENKNRAVGIVSEKIRADSNKDFGAVIPVKKVFEKWPQLEQLNTAAAQHVLIDFMPYIDRLIYDFEHYDEYILNQREPIIPIMARCDLNKSFVSLRAIDSNGNEINPLDDFIAAWLQDSERRHVTILGDFGTGKSSYGLKLCYDLAKRYREDPVGNPVPLFVQLGLFSRTKLQEFEHYIADELLPRYGIKPPLFSDLMEFWHSGKLLIFLDGFDEMSANKDRQSIHHNFNELRQAIRRKSKSIMTCRTNYFTHESRVTELFNPESGAGLEAQYELLQLRKFNEEQIIAYLKKNAANKWEFYWERIKNNYDLSDLSGRPVLLHMIVKTLPQLIKPDTNINIASLYEKYTREWLRKGEQDERVTFMTTEERERFMQELSFEMFIQWQENISLGQLKDKIDSYFHRLGEGEFDYFERDVRTCTFLHRKSNSFIYRFTHRTFMDYFVAQKLIRDLLENHSYESMGKKPLTPEICTFFIGMVENKGILEEIKEELLHFIEISKEPDFDREKHKYLAGNAISLLNKMKVDLRGCDFSHTSLISADLTYTNLQHTNFENANLEGVNFNGSDLCDCNLKNASIKDVYLGRPDEIRLVVYRPDGKYLLSAHSDNSIRLWNAHSGGELVHIKNAHTQKVNCVCFNPVKKHFASSSNDMLIKIWRYEEKDEEGISVDREPILEFQGHRLSVESISFDPTGKYLISGSYDHTARRWDLDQPINAKCRILEGHTNAVFAVNSDHEKYVVTGSWDTTVKIWKIFLTDTRCIRTLEGHTKPVFSVSVSPGQGLVASGSSDKSLRVWKLDSGETVFIYDKHNGSVRHVCFSPTGLYLASGCWDSLVRVWRTNDWKLLFQLPGHGAPVWGVRFSPDDTQLVSCYANGTIKIWRTADGSLLKTIETSDPSLFLNYKGMNVTHLKGCSRERIEFFKERGAIEEE